MNASKVQRSNIYLSLEQGEVPEGMKIWEYPEGYTGDLCLIHGRSIIIQTQMHMDDFKKIKMRRDGRMEDAQDPVMLVDTSKEDAQDPVMHVDTSKEEDAFESTLRRAREDTHFRTYFLLSLVSGDTAYISKIFGGLSTDDPRLSALIKENLALKAWADALSRQMEDDCCHDFCVTPGQDDALIAEMHREGRKKDAQDFRREYYYGSSMDEKVFVCADLPFPWSDESSGVTWLGLHGMNSICVVTKARELDVTRVHRYLKYNTVEKALCKFRKTVISEIEDLASPSSRFTTMFGKSIPKPFGVVSLALGSDAHEESGRMESSDEDEEENKIWEKRREYMPEVPGYDEKKTIKYLREQMRKDKEKKRTKKQQKRKGKTRTNDETAKASSIAASSYLQNKMKLMDLEDFNVEATIKTAISAFQCLFGKEFKSHEIGVSVMDPGYVIRERKFDIEDFHAQHLDMNEIQKYLAAINGCVQPRVLPRLK